MSEYQATLGESSTARLTGVGAGPAERRVVAWSLGLAAIYLVAIGGATSRGLWFLDGARHGIATDFLAFWGAGRMALDGTAPLAYDIAHLKLVQEIGLGQAYGGSYPWLYPPTFLLAIAPVALLPYVPALFLWAGTTLVTYLAAMRAILPRWSVVAAALAAPAVCSNLITGQNGLLTAALLGGGLALMERRPWVAGVLFGLLAYKPQFGLLLPVALAAAGRWRTILAAAATVIVAAAISAWLFGWASWTAFFSSAGGTADRVLLEGNAGIFKLQSIYAALRLLGASNATAWLGHGAVAAVTAFGVFRLWQRPAPFGVKAAGLVTGTLVVTPYAFVYDLALLTVPVAFLVREVLATGARPAERLALTAALFLPALFFILPSPVGIPCYATLAAQIWRRSAAPLDAAG